MKESIVCYFSASGTTKQIAEKLSSVINSDLFEILPVDVYTSEDLNWNNSNSRSSIEMKDSSCRVEIKNKLENMDNYKNIIIGYPIWWDLAPRIINTFIESNDLIDKNIYLFATSGGSSINGSVNNLKKQYPNINFVNAKLLTGYMSTDELSSWLNK